MINGVTELTVTLLDVLSGFDELRVCTGYRTRGVVTDRFLPDGSDLGGVEPVYETLAGFVLLGDMALGFVQALLGDGDLALARVDLVQAAMAVGLIAAKDGEK